MRLSILLCAAAGLALTACAPSTNSSANTANAPTAASLETIGTVVGDPTRLEEHTARDGGRKPAEILELSGILPGDKVGEFAAGGGYYTGLLSRLVGDDGHVYVYDPRLIFDVFPQAEAGFDKYLEQDPRGNVSRVIGRLDAYKAPEPLDSVMMVLYYHDTVWTGEDRGLMNAAIYDALKSGGTYVVVDHHGKVGAGDEITQSLHRMDATPVIGEITAAGFELVVNSDVLAHPDDPRDVSVFDAAWRGKTDRFVYVFRKP